jgi:pimeloyl-ACP methyl ester carboxylesterase
MTGAYQERAVLFGRERTLVGISCRPSRFAGERPSFIFLNSGIVHRVGANRIYVMLARALADKGFSSLRFDLAGVGDSRILPNSQAMDPQERTEVDIDDALEFSSRHLESDRFIMAGLCSGADNALRTMGRHDNVVGSILLDLNTYRTRGYYLRHYSKRLVRSGTWRNVLTGKTLRGRIEQAKRQQEQPQKPSMDTMLPATSLPPTVMRDHLERVVASDRKLLAIFTAGLDEQYNYETQFLDMLPGLDFGRSLRLEYFSDSDHSFSRQHWQQRLRSVVIDWAEGTDFPRPDALRARGARVET